MCYAEHDCLPKLILKAENMLDAMDILTARQCLQQSMEKSKEIGKSLQKSGQNLLHIEKDRANLEHVMSPLLSQSKELQRVSELVDGAVEPILGILEALESIRRMEAILVDDPLEDLHKYVKTISDLKEELRHINQNYPAMVESLKAAIQIAGESRISDSYKMHVLNEALASLEMMGPQSFMENESGLMDSALGRLESAFLSVLMEISVPRNLHGENRAEEEKLALTLDLEAVGLLQLIAERLKDFGRGQSCLKLYWGVRIKSLRETFKSMDTHYLRYNTSDSVNKVEWHDLEGYVAEWLVVLTKTVKVLVSTERNLCSRVFETFEEDVWTKCFGGLIFRSGMSALIEFGEAVALSERQPQKLFKLLDMVEGLESLKEDFGRLFEGSGCIEIGVRVQELEIHLVHSACQMLRDFGKKIEEDSGISFEGAAPKITSYVVNYLKFMVTEYGKVMTEVLKMEDNSGLAEAIGYVMNSLELNLETRAKGYSNPALAHIFLMNNYWYIFKRARDSELGSVLGEAWLKQRRRLVNQHVLGYEKDEWSPLLKQLNRDGLIMSSGGRGEGRDLFKQRLKAFNTILETIYETHKSWVISDEDLREATFVKIVQAVVPAYRSYVETFSHLLEQIVNGRKHLRYTPEQLEGLLSDLFTEKSRGAGLPNRNRKRGDSDTGFVSI